MMKGVVPLFGCRGGREVGAKWAPEKQGGGFFSGLGVMM